MGLLPLYAGLISGSAPFIRRVDIWVCALYTQGCWQGIIYTFGSVPRYTGIWPGIIYTFGSVSRYTGIWPGIIYIYIYNTKIYICVCVHMICLSHSRVVPI